MATVLETFTKDPVAFMKKNLVLVKCGGPKAIIEVTLNLSTQHTAKKGGVGNIATFELEAKPGGARAYWLPYWGNSAHQMTLGSHANLVFTPTMDGCTFAVGEQQDGLVKVAHVNYTQEVKGVLSADKTKVDDALTQIYSGPASKKLTPDDYRDLQDATKGVVQLSTFGVRNGSGDWDSYYQKRLRTGAGKNGFTFELVDVFPI